MNRKAFLACVLMCVILTGCETAKKISEVIKNPDIQVGSLKEQPSEITVTLLTEPDTNTNAEGESAAVDVQLVYLTDDSKLLAADYDQIASTPLPDVLGKNYIDHQDFNLLPDTIKTLPPVFHCVPLWWLPASFLTIPGSAISNSTRVARPGQKWLPPGPLHCMFPAVSRI